MWAAINPLPPAVVSIFFRIDHPFRDLPVTSTLTILFDVELDVFNLDRQT
jgi:hypothetical protein